MSIEPLPVPLRELPNGTIRIGDSRIALERVIEEYLNGSTPEQIVENFDTLRLADVYAVLAYYLTHQREVEEYLRRQDQEAEAVRHLIEASQPPRPGFLAELLARRARREL
jgi:uncharacterized protein (DUF433 family)